MLLIGTDETTSAGSTRGLGMITQPPDGSPFFGVGGRGSPTRDFSHTSKRFTPNSL
ncbi:hypothetical protein [Streptomyces hydrogenans]|uniref:hypothetical protein n=1 Tax=Streptomyces hydrogenans TaxID=1873719 RepID=UPI001CFEF8F8|nr:hypothetical protein [Streptomyces hydrogenans]